MPDALDQLGDLALRYAQIRGGTVSVKLNAWPGEIQLLNAADLKAGSSSNGPGLVRGQLVIRDGRGKVVQTIGPEVRQNWILTGAIVGGLAALLFVILRGMTPHRKG